MLAAVVLLLLGTALAGMSILSGQVNAQGKPGPKITWQVKIEPLAGSNLYAPESRPEGVYQDAESAVNVSCGYITYIQTKLKQTCYTPYFRLELLPGAEIGILGLFPDGLIGGETPGFAGGFGADGLLSLFDFLNGVHPQTGYSKVVLNFSGPSSQILDEADFSKMIVGEKRKIKLDLMIIGQDIYGDCSQCNPVTNHSIKADAFGYPDIGATSDDPYDLYIQRMDTDNWAVFVDTNFDNPDYLPDPAVFDYNDGRIYQEYCVCTPVTVRNRTTMQKSLVRPYWAQTHLKFALAFTKKTL